MKTIMPNEELQKKMHDFAKIIQDDKQKLSKKTMFEYRRDDYGKN